MDVGGGCSDGVDDRSLLRFGIYNRSLGRLFPLGWSSRTILPLHIIFVTPACSSAVKNGFFSIYVLECRIIPFGRYISPY